MSFTRAVEEVLKSEGGYSNDERDPGNWTGGKVGVGKLNGTKFGISAKAYPHLDIRNLTRTDAIHIYRRDYWDRLSCGQLPDGVAMMVFDAAVNQGPALAAKMLQQAAGVTVDGNIGPKTLAAVNSADPETLLDHIAAERALHYAGLPTFSAYGRGWMRRLIRVARLA